MNGADLNANDNNNTTALMKASKKDKEYSEIMEYLARNAAI